MQMNGSYRVQCRGLYHSCAWIFDSIEAQQRLFDGVRITSRRNRKHHSRTIGEVEQPSDRYGEYLGWQTSGKFCRVPIDGVEQPAYVGREYVGWYVKGNFHRGSDMPAVMYANGTREWWVNGKRHRDNDKPAYVRINGVIQRWYVNGYLHRNPRAGIVGPAIQWGLGELEWFGDGEYHRDPITTISTVKFDTKWASFSITRDIKWGEFEIIGNIYETPELLEVPA